jgi:hypothetical protein
MMPSVNRAAQKLNRTHLERGAKAHLAKEIEIDQGYLGRILSGERTPGMDVRQRFWRVKRIPMHWWDEPVPNANHSANKPAA